MASVSVLRIADSVFGPHLELIRRICEPHSKSLPHVTVRFFDKLPVPPDHFEARIGYVDLVGLGTFGLDGRSSQRNKTVYIRCLSDDLLAIEHKPDFPTSEFHITLYDGESATFARRLFDVLSAFQWRFRIRFDEKSNSLTSIEIKKRRKRPAASPLREYRDYLKAIFFDATGQRLTVETLICASDAERLKLVARVMRHLVHASDELEGAPEADTAPSGETKRSTFDVHLTPPELANAIARYCLSFSQCQEIDFGDPSIGTGVFFSALLRNLNGKILRSAIGIDINPDQIAAANWRWARKGLRLLEGDYLHMENLPPRNVILANPPYLRQQRIPNAYKSDLQQRASVVLGMKISGLAGQYVYFLILAHSWMAAGCISAWLVPSEFMRSRYGAALRYYLTKRVTLIRIHQFAADDVQFENARVLPSVIVFKNSTPLPSSRALLTIGGELENPQFSTTREIGNLGFQDRWSIGEVAFNCETNVRERQIRIGDLFEIRRGIATGANSFFILPRPKAAEIGIPEECLRPILPKAKLIEGDVVEQCLDGYPKLVTQLSLIDTSMTTEFIRDTYPGFWRYLQSGIESGLLERNLIRSRRPWYSQERRAPPPFVCTYMSRTGTAGIARRFIWNRTQAVASNTYLLLYPRQNLAALLLESVALYPLVLRMLASSVDSVNDMSRFHAGGLTKIEPGDLKQVMLRNIPSDVRALAAKELL